jgi:hypothetical protein
MKRPDRSTPNRPSKPLAVAAVLVLLAGSAAAQLNVTIETVALSSESAPGTAASFQLFDAAFVNDLGEVAFHSRLTPTNQESVWLWNEVGGLDLQSLESFLDIDDKSLRVSNLGVAHGKNLTVNEIWGPDSAGDPQLLSSDGGSAPGGGTFDLSSVDEEELLLSNFGLALFTSIDDGSNLEAVFRQSSFALQEVYREGDLAPGAGTDTFVAFNVGVMNDSGELSFDAYVNLTGGRGLFGPSASGTTLLLRTGDAVPGVAGAQFRGFGTESSSQGINNAGQVAFNGNMIVGPGGVTGLDDRGIWGPAAGTGFSLVARSGSAAAEAGAATWAGFDSLVLNANAAIAFEGSLTGAGIDSNNGTGLWAALQGGALQLVARAGNAAPGIPGSFLAGASEFNFALNAHDQMAFAAELDTGGAAIWLYDLASDTVELVLGPGESVEVGTGDDRTVVAASFGDAQDLEAHTGGEDGKKSVFNDAGQMAALLEFTDGSVGVFRITVDNGLCEAADGEDLALSDDTVTGTEVYEVCGTLTVGTNFEVAGPSGDLTLRAGGQVVLDDGFSVGLDGELTVDNDASL